MTHCSRLRTLTAAFSDQPGNRSSWLLAPTKVHPWNRKGELAGWMRVVIKTKMFMTLIKLRNGLIPH